MNIIQIIYTIFTAFIVLVAALLIVSAMPVTGNYRIMTVLSGSMEPAIGTGSIVVVASAGDYRAGDVVTFGAPEKNATPITHRIQSVTASGGEAVYVTKGDANNAPDIKTVRKSDILGKVVFIVPFAGFAVSAAKKPWGFALIVVIPAAIIIFDESKKIYGELKSKKPNA